LKNKIGELKRQTAKDYYQGKVNDLFQSKPQQWYKEVKKLVGKEISASISTWMIQIPNWPTNLTST
jgi:uncharacterized protein YukE